MTCPSCGTENREGRKFCSKCGTPLAAACPSCGAQNEPGDAFCGECGAALTATPSPQPRAAPSPPQAERRLVSVLFADLVGFTAASEGRDAEDTRELLSRYFETARTIVDRYGGTVEKFIGDAVMAVWGAPVAQEDDAERAVRAALELVAAVVELGEEVEAPELQLRAGVLTGEAAVTVGAEGQGMVAGDLVNTASRIQSEALRGTVLVGERTRRASEAAIVYEDAGERELKGKAEPVPLWRALRVVASRGGEGRSAGLEAPFVGRDRELRLVKDLFHATSEEGRARLLSVVGVAGIGKSRLSWEFEKYLDGLADNFWWHRGRCLSYGDGVAYWALAEMVRGRIGVREDEDPSVTETKVRETVAQHVADREERDWIEQRLLHLVGLSERAASDREDLFPAWRRFFERLAEQQPVVLIFEDLHWADAGLVGFIEHLLDWSRNHAIFVLTLARPELSERHPTFPGGTRNATTMPLDRLPDEAMDELLRGLVPGLPDDVRSRIRERADGIPLYAVETVRMLLDRGLLEQAGSEYRLTGPVERLEVPETLHALIASRLDGLPDAEHRLLQDGAVLGKTFTQRGLAALSGTSEEDVEPLTASLVRKEILYLETDPRSPERGQYGFLQALVQRVAYETLSRRERRSRHIAAAEFMARDSGLDPTEIAEVIAAHYLDALAADEDAPDAAEIKASARAWFVRAAERSASLAASSEAQRGFERAASLADDVDRASLLVRAGEAGRMAGDFGAVERILAEAIAVFGRAGLTYEEAEASSKLAAVLFSTGRIEEAVERMETSLAVFEERGDEAAVATVSTQLGRFLFFEGDRARALEHTERGLELGERLRLPEVVSQGLNTKALLLRDRPYESIALIRGALAVARDHDLGAAAMRAYNNLSYLLWVTGAPNYEVEDVIREGLALARRRGDRMAESSFAGQLAATLFPEGRWDELGDLADELPEQTRFLGSTTASQLPGTLALIDYHRGDNAGAAALVSDWAALPSSADLQLEAARTVAQAIIDATKGRSDRVLGAMRNLVDEATSPQTIEIGLELGGDAAAELTDADSLEQLLAGAERADVAKPPSLLAVCARLRARLSAMRDEEDPPFGRAVALLREIGERFPLAGTLLEQAEWLIGQGRGDEAGPLLAEAREFFVPLRATPWIERIERAEAKVPTAVEAAANPA